MLAASLGYSVGALESRPRDSTASEPCVPEAVSIHLVLCEEVNPLPFPQEGEDEEEWSDRS